jgi:hypothetical protein
MQILIPVLLLAALLFWLYQLIDVISMKDHEFDGHNDKLIFFLLVFFGSVFGAIGFSLWKWSRDKARESDARLAAAMKDVLEDTGRNTPQKDAGT